MRRRNRAISILLTVCLLIGMIPAAVLPAFAAETSDVGSTETGGAVTRAQWIVELVAAFGMTVEEETAPDNYFSDLTGEEEYYRDILVAVEFGVVDIEAGHPFRPEDPATREFAAQTLNFSLGYRLDEGAAYTYSEVADVTYPDDIQIAVNRGWFALVDGAFLPEQPITEEEKTAMLADVAAILADDELDKDHENTATVAEGVVEVPAGTVFDFPEENTIVMLQCPVTIQAGDIFVVFQDGLPLAFKAVSVAATELSTTVVYTTEGTDDAIVDYDYEGTVSADLSDFEGTEATTYTLGSTTVYVSETSRAISYDKGSKVLTASKTVSLGDGIDATISVKISNISFDLEAKKLQCKYRCVMNGVATLSTNVSVDMMEALGAAKTIELGRVSIAGVGYIKLSVEFSLSGEMTLTWSGDMKAGFTYNLSEGLRVVRSFKKKSFTFMAEVTLKTGLRMDAGVDVLVFDANVWAKIGAQLDVKYSSYDTGKPSKCFDMDGFMYASVGVNGSIIKIFDFSKTHDIYTRSNSPIRAHYHYEDGVWVSSCTRGKNSGGNNATSSDYYTDPGSNHFTPGVSNGSSSYTGAGGQQVVIFTYDLDEENNATITGYHGGASALYIPATIDGYTVTAIGSNAFKGKTGLYTVRLSNSITHIGSNAFANCSNLSVVTLPASLVELGSGAFSNCIALTEITFPDSLLTIGEEAFKNCSSIQVFELPRQLSTIGKGAFENCTSLTELYIPISVQEGSVVYTYNSVFDNAYGVFNGCSNLRVVRFEEGTTYIHDGLFAGSGLSEIVLPDTVTSIGSYAFAFCRNLQKVTLPDDLTTINEYAFWYCSSLEEMIFPNKVSVIGKEAFSQCTALSKVYIPISVQEGSITYTTNTVFDNAFGIFNGCSNLTEVIFEEGTTIIHAGLFSGSGLKNVVIPETVTKIQDYAFAFCRQLESIVLPEALTSIGERAFWYCSALLKVKLPDAVVSLGDYVFAQCTALENVDMSHNLATIGRECFANCTSLKKIFIPKSLRQLTYNTSYKGGPFSECSSLAEVEFEDGIEHILGYLFARCTGLKRVVVPETVTDIGEYAFYGCVSLESAQVPDSVSSMGTYIFMDCKSLVDVRLPSIRQNLMQGTFKNCTSLVNLELPKSLTAIRSEALENCSSLTNLVIPEGVTVIENYAFKNCASLTEVIIPRGVTSVGNEAFYGCVSLVKIDMPDTLQTVGNHAFYNCDVLDNVIIPESVTSIGKYAFAYCDSLCDITLGRGITTIYEGTFYECPSLLKINIPYTVNSIQEKAFANCTKLTEVTIHRNVTTIAANTFSYPSILTVYGVVGTTAETHANEIGAKFVPIDYPATVVKLNETELNINRGSSYRLILDITPENFTDMITWKSSDTDVVTVTDRGELKAVGVGTATVKVTVGNVSASCKVTVIQPVTRIGLNRSTLSLEGGESYTLTATVSPDNAANKAVTWESSDPAIASVDQNGVVTAHARGTATITVTAQDGSGVSAQCTVTVTNALYAVNDPAEMESPHDYEVNCKDVWVYTAEGALELKVTFDEKTEMEDGFDYLYILDGEGNEIGKYTGKELAGVTVTVPGDTVKIRMASDDSGTAWGFKVSGIESATHVHTPEILEGVKATCTESGLTEGSRCAECGEVLAAQEVIPATGHNTELKNARKAACTEAGYTGDWVCKDCGKVVEQGSTIPAKGHDEVTDQAVSATCTETGLTEGKHCVVCDAVTVKQETIPAKGHSWDEGTVTVEPTENAQGVKTFTCSLCGELKTEVIPALGHTHKYQKAVVPPECTKQGYTKYTCTCGDSYDSDYMAALGHSWDNGIVTTQPGETTPGVRTYTCATCGETKTVEIPATGHIHSYGAVVVHPTCTEQGYTKYTCSCGDSYITNIKNPIGHTFTQWIVTQEPDGDRPGIKTRVCFCGYKENEALLNPFQDVPSGKYFSKPVFWAYENGITTGKTATTFELDADCTRKQIVTFLWRAAGKPEPKSMENPFTDVKADQFEKAILWAYYEGITAGKTATEFQPEAPCTREQIVMFLWRFNGKPEPETMANPFADVRVGGTFEKAILWAYYEGVTTGKTATTFEPQATCTRGQIVTFLYRDRVEG